MCVATIVAGAMTPLWGHYIVTIGGNLKTAGIALGIYFISGCFFDLPLAYLEDKYPKYHLYLAISWVILMICWIWYYFINTPLQLYGVLTLFSFALCIMLPAANALFTIKLAPGTEATGWGVWNAAINIGAAIGAIAGSHIVHFSSYKTLFIVMAIVSTIAIFISFLVSSEKKENTSPKPATVVTQQQKDQSNIYIKLLNKNLIKLMSFMFIFAIVATAMSPLWGHYILTIGGSIKTAGTAVAILFFGRFLFSITLSSFQNRFPHYVLYLKLGCLIMVVTWILFCFVETVHELFGVLILLSCGQAIIAPAFSTLFTKTLPKGAEATGWGIYYISVDLGNGVGAAAGGHIVNYINYNALFLIMAGVCAVAFFAAFLVPAKIPDIES